jgi:hypothetical protein
MDAANRTYMRKLMSAMNLICTVTCDLQASCDALAVMSLLVSSLGLELKSDGFLSAMRVFEALFRAVLVNSNGADFLTFLSLVETMMICYGADFRHICQNLRVLPEIRAAIDGKAVMRSPRNIWAQEFSQDLDVDIDYEKESVDSNLRMRLCNLEVLFAPSSVRSVCHGFGHNDSPTAAAMQF